MANIEFCLLWKEFAYNYHIVFFRFDNKKGFGHKQS